MAKLNSCDDFVREMDITIYSTEMFYRLVKYLNESFGHGAKNWTIHGRILRHLRNGNVAYGKLYIFSDKCTDNMLVYIRLITM